MTKKFFKICTVSSATVNEKSFQIMVNDQKTAHINEQIHLL